MNKLVKNLLVIVISLSILLIALLLGAQLSMPVTQAATLCVNPGGTGGCYSSIQTAINSAFPGDTIVVAAGAYIENLIIDRHLTIAGAGSATTIVDGNKANHVVKVNALVQATISGLTIQNGKVTGDVGAGIHNEGALILANSLVTKNIVVGTVAEPGAGGGIVNLGWLLLSNTTVSDNIIRAKNLAGPASPLGGGIANAGMLTLDGSSVLNNTIVVSNTLSNYGLGGGIANSGWLTIANNSLISGNSISILGSGNSMGGGGGIANGGWLSIADSRVDNNIVEVADYTALAFGAGIVHGDMSFILPTLPLASSRLQNGGPALYFAITDTSVSGNKLLIEVSDGSSGIGVALGGGIACQDNLSLSHCEINDNKAIVHGSEVSPTIGVAGGGGVFASMAITATEGSTINRNKVKVNAAIAGGLGGGIGNSSLNVLFLGALSGGEQIAAPRFGAPLLGNGIAPSVLLSDTMVAENEVKVTPWSVSTGSVSGIGIALGGGVASEGDVILRHAMINWNQAIMNGDETVSSTLGATVGGGICSGASITSTNSTIQGNLARIDAAIALGVGGGIANGELNIVVLPGLPNAIRPALPRFGAPSFGSSIFGSASLSNTLVIENDLKVNVQVLEIYIGEGGPEFLGGLGIALGGGIAGAGDVTLHQATVDENNAVVKGAKFGEGEDVVPTLAIGIGGGICAGGAITGTSSSIDDNQLKLEAVIVLGAGGGSANLGWLDIPLLPNLPNLGQNAAPLFQSPRLGEGLQAGLFLADTSVAGNDLTATVKRLDADMNLLGMSGGGLALGGGLASAGNVILSNNEIVENSISLEGDKISPTLGIAAGGGICTGAAISDTNSTISGNSVNVDASIAIGLGGGIANSALSIPILSDMPDSGQFVTLSEKVSRFGLTAPTIEPAVILNNTEIEENTVQVFVRVAKDATGEEPFEETGMAFGGGIASDNKLIISGSDISYNRVELRGSLSSPTMQMGGGGGISNGALAMVIPFFPALQAPGLGGLSIPSLSLDDSDVSDNRVYIGESYKAEIEGESYLNDLTESASLDSSSSGLGKTMISPSTGKGGGILAGGDVTITNGSGIYDNRVQVAGPAARAIGGGLAIEGVVLDLNSPTTMSETPQANGFGLRLIVTDAEIVDNSALANVIKPEKYTVPSELRIGRARGGGIATAGEVETTISYSVIDWNTASASGLSDKPSYASKLRATGGGLILSGIADISCSEINSNDAYTEYGDNQVSRGGGIQVGRSVPCELLLTNSEISDNEAEQGGGIYIRNHSSVEILFCDIENNDNTGIWVQSQQQQFGESPVAPDSAISNQAGLTSSKTPQTVNLGGGLPSLEAHWNNIVGNIIGIRNNSPTTFYAENNFWGCAAGPGNAGCDDYIGDVIYAPFRSTRFEVLLTKSDYPDPLPAGWHVRYTIEIKNSAAETNNVLVTDTLPAHVGLTFRSITPPGVYDSARNTIKWNLIMNPGDTQVLKLELSTESTMPRGPMTNTVTVTMGCLVLTAAETTKVVDPPIAPETGEWICPRGGFPDYAPHGVPDFDMRQANWQSSLPLKGLSAAANWTYSGPAAAANALWYLDAQAESVLGHKYSLVTAYGATADHSAANVPPLISDLAAQVQTSASGTTLEDMVTGLRAYLVKQGVSSAFTVASVKGPAQPWLIEQAKRTNGVMLLLLGIWQQNGSQWTRVGGHWVTICCADWGGLTLDLADPFFDRASLGNLGRSFGGVPLNPTTHNDAGKVSYDTYYFANTKAPGASFALRNYGDQALLTLVNNALDQNLAGELEMYRGAYNSGLPVQIIADYAVFIRPVSGYPTPTPTPVMVAPATPTRTVTPMMTPTPTRTPKP